LAGSIVRGHGKTGMDMRENEFNMRVCTAGELKSQHHKLSFFNDYDMIMLRFSSFNGCLNNPECVIVLHDPIPISYQSCRYEVILVAVFVLAASFIALLGDVQIGEPQVVTKRTRERGRERMMAPVT
jgi:hypothetical protein